MAKKTLLISTTILKARTPIQHNVDDDLLAPYILKAQETHIKSFLGFKLYNKIVKDKENNTLIDNYLDLYDNYIVPALAEYTFYEVLPFIQLKMTNKSIVKGNSEYQTESDLSDLKYLRQTVLDLAEFYGKELINYLKEYYNNFPEYYDNNGLNENNPVNTSFFNGIYIPSTNNYDCCNEKIGKYYKKLN